MDPHWERGYRVHGYWIGNVRIGWVGLPPGRGTWKQLGYGWGLDKPVVEGREPSLQKAKQAVEKALARS